MEVTKKELLELIHAVQNEAYAAAAAPNAPRRKQGSVDITLFKILWIAAGILTIYALMLYISAQSAPLLPEPRMTFSTPVAPAALPRPVQQPVTNQQRHTPFYRPTDVPVFAGEIAQPTPTATWMPTVEGEFWTPEEQTAFAVEATATTQAFYEAIPTAPAEFVQYVDEKCKDAELVASSWLLQEMCKGGGDE